MRWIPLLMIAIGCSAPAVESDAVVSLRKQIAAGGLVTLPAGVHTIYSPIVVNGSLVGPGTEACIIDYRGDPSKAAIRVDRQWGYRLQGFSVRGLGRKGTGIEVTTDTPYPGNGYGTNSGNSIWENVSVYSFATGVKVGSQAGTPAVPKPQAASEMTYVNLKCADCTQAIWLSGFDTLNQIFTNLGIADCENGLMAYEASSILIRGGSASSCKNVLFQFVHSSSVIIDGYRTENCGVCAVLGGVTTPLQFTITNCLWHQRAGFINENVAYWTREPMVISGGAGATLTDCRFFTDNPNAIGWARNGNDCRLHIIGGNSSSANLVRDWKIGNVRPGHLLIKNVNKIDRSSNSQGWFPNVDGSTQ